MVWQVPLSAENLILRTLVYADVFDYPLMAEEIWQFLISSKKIEKKEILKTIDFLGKKKKLEKKDKFYFLTGREKIVEKRKKREGWSREKMKIARRTAFWLKLIPSVLMVGVTGALAMDNVDKGDDIDFLIVTRKNRLWLTRMMAIFLMEVLGRRRRPKAKRVRNKICLNMFLDEEHLAVGLNGRNLYTAHEVCQLKPLWQKEGVYKKFIYKNRWRKKYLINWKA